MLLIAFAKKQKNIDNNTYAYKLKLLKYIISSIIKQVKKINVSTYVRGGVMIE